MKNIKITTLFLLLTSILFGQKYTTTDAGSKAGFTIKNLGIKTNGSFSGIKGNIFFDPANLAKSTFSVSVDANTVNTDNSLRDKHLRKEEYFNVAKYPTLNFVSTKVSKSTVAGTFVMYGNLTIKGVTKAVNFNFVPTTTATGYLFKGGFEINRRDFKVGGKSISMSDVLKINLEIAAVK